MQRLKKACDSIKPCSLQQPEIPDRWSAAVYSPFSIRTKDYLSIYQGTAYVHVDFTDDDYFDSGKPTASSQKPVELIHLIAERSLESLPYQSIQTMRNRSAQYRLLCTVSFARN